MQFRAYNDHDLEAVRRIWLECGWITGKDDHAAMDAFFTAGRKRVAEIDGEAECFVMTGHGSMHYIGCDKEIPFAPVFAVTTSRVARKLGVAGRLTARCVAEDASEGAPLAGLGMFEQGYYDKLGFGSGSYVHRFTFDPQTLKLPSHATYRRPKRLSPEALGEAIHRNRMERKRCHGSIRFEHSAITTADLDWGKQPFALGFFDENENLTHHLFGRTGGEEYGPYTIHWMAWRTPQELLELLGVIRAMGDQVRSVVMEEPVGVQLQDLLDQPGRRRAITEKSPFEQSQRAIAYWQMRINDVAACVSRTRLPGEDAVRFNLDLHDPITSLLDDSDTSWSGCGGQYVVTFGPESHAERGSDASLLTLKSSVNAFTRLWLGVRTASGLNVTEQFTGPEPLLDDLDRVLRLPQPTIDWDF